VRRYLKSGAPPAGSIRGLGAAGVPKAAQYASFSSVGLLRGMERAGILRSADAVIREMTRPDKPDRRPQDRRAFSDLPDGADEPAAIGSRWAGSASRRVSHG